MDFVTFFFSSNCPLLKHCKIYLCGTKSDLIEADRGLRQVDYHDVQDFADGKSHVLINLMLAGQYLMTIILYVNSAVLHLFLSVLFQFVVEDLC